MIFFFIGILGFWSGMMPRALGEALTVALGAGIAYGLNMYADKNLKSYTSHISSFLAASLCYPFTVVSHCSIGEFMVEKSGVKNYGVEMADFGNFCPKNAFQTVG